MAYDSKKNTETYLFSNFEKLPSLEEFLRLLLVISKKKATSKKISAEDIYSEVNDPTYSRQLGFQNYSPFNVEKIQQILMVLNSKDNNYLLNLAREQMFLLENTIYPYTDLLIEIFNTEISSGTQKIILTDGNLLTLDLILYYSSEHFKNINIEIWCQTYALANCFEKYFLEYENLTFVMKNIRDHRKDLVNADFVIALMQEVDTFPIDNISNVKTFKVRNYFSNFLPSLYDSILEITKKVKIITLISKSEFKNVSNESFLYKSLQTNNLHKIININTFQNHFLLKDKSLIIFQKSNNEENEKHYDLTINTYRLQSVSITSKKLKILDRTTDILAKDILLEEKNWLQRIRLDTEIYTLSSNSTTLEQVAIRLSRFGHLQKTPINEKTEVKAKLIDIKDMSNEFSSFNKMEESFFSRWNLENYLIQEGDIIITVRASKFKMLFIDRPITENILPSANLQVIRVDPEKYLPEFLYFYLNGPLAQAYFKSLITGRYLFHISIQALKDLKIPDLSLKEQKKIMDELKQSQQMIANMIKKETERHEKVITNMYHKLGIIKVER